MMEFAPGLLSITTGWPQVSCIFAPTTRAMMSLPPPGGNPTTMRIGFDGQVCPELVEGPNAAVAAAHSAMHAMCFVNAGRMRAILCSAHAPRQHQRLQHLGGAAALRERGDPRARRVGAGQQGQRA